MLQKFTTIVIVEQVFIKPDVGVVDVLLDFLDPLMQDGARGDDQRGPGLDRLELHPAVGTEVLAAIGILHVIANAFQGKRKAKQ